MSWLVLCALVLAKGPKVPVAPPPPPEVVVAPAPPPDPLGPQPTPTATPDFKPPVPVAMQLSNGASLWVISAPSLPLVSIVIEVPGGGSLDPIGKEGLASLSDRLMSKGAGKRSASAFAEEVERLGIQLDVGTGTASSYISVSAQKDQIDEALNLVASMILEPTYKGKDWKLERRLAAMEVAAGQDDPTVVARRLATALFMGPGSAWGRPPEGTVQGIAAAKLPELKAYHRSTWAPSGAKITVAGALSVEEAKGLLESSLISRWPAAPAAVVPAPNVPAHNAEPIYVVDRPGSAQTVFYLVFPGTAYAGPNEAALRSGTIILGGTFTSRLNQLLREKKGYTYGVRARMVQYAQTGSLVISTRIRTDATDEAMVDLMSELQRLKEGVTPEEAEKARLAHQQDQVEAMESRSGIAGAFSEYHFAGLPPQSLQEGLAASRALTVEQINAALSAYDPTKAVIILVGDKKAIEEPLKAAGFTAIESRPAI